MKYETKLDVFEEMKWELIRNLANTIDQNGGLRPLEDATKVGENYATRYDAALPDNLPVLPEEVSDRLKQAKADKSSLRYMFACSSFNTLSDWWMAKNTKNEDVFARSWLDGVWIVEETGEIVKLEAED